MKSMTMRSADFTYSTLNSLPLLILLWLSFEGNLRLGMSPRGRHSGNGHRVGIEKGLQT